MPNVPVYLIGLLLIVIAVLGWTLVVQRGKYDLLEARYEAFKAQTAAEGLKAASAQKDLKAAYLQIADTLEKTRVNLHAQLDKSYADYERLRKSADSSSNRVRSLTEAITNIDCGAATKARLERALEQIEAGVLRELGKPRDAAVIEANSCNDKLDKIIAAQPQP
jgi:hypothetical protein